MRIYKYSDEELLSLFKDVVANETRHDLYESDKEIADFWKMVMSAEGQDKILLSIRENESEAQKLQRQKIYNSVTREVTNKITTTLKEVDRCDSIRDVVEYSTDSQKAKDSEQDIEMIRNMEASFYGEKSVDSFLDQYFMMYSLMDPNAFLLVDFETSEEDGKNYVYPSVVKSEMVMHYEYDNGILQYLMFETKDRVLTKKNGKNTPELFEDIRIFWCYGPEKAWKLTEIRPDQMEKPTDRISLEKYNRFKIDLELKDGKVQKGRTIQTGPAIKTDVEYYLEEFEPKAKRVPAIKFGHTLNISNEGQNYESLLVPAKEIFRDIIYKKSTYDLHLALHGIAQKFVYVAACNYHDEETATFCKGGKIQAGAAECPKCKGSGKMPIHRSEQDIITLEITLNEGQLNEEVIDLSKLVYYAEIPKHIIEMHKQEVHEGKVNIVQAIFNNDRTQKSEVTTVTATELRSNKTSVNNVLSEYAARKAEHYKFILEQIAIYNNLDDDLAISRKYPSDFKLETVEDLFQQRTAAINANAPEHIIQSIDKSILYKQNLDDPEIVERIITKEKFRPLNDRGDSDRQTALSLLPDADPKRILILYFDDVFAILEHDKKYKSFWETDDYKKQKKMLEEVLQLFIDRYQEAQAGPEDDGIPLDPTGEPIEGGPEPGEGEEANATGGTTTDAGEGNVDDVLALYLQKSIDEEAAIAQLQKITGQDPQTIRQILINVRG